MKIMQVITDYIAKSILTNQGDILTRSGTGPARIAAVSAGSFLETRGLNLEPVWSKPTITDLGIKTGFFNKSAGGAEVITGVGFQPKAVLFFCRDITSTNLNWSLGIDLVTEQKVLYQHTGGTYLGATIDDSINIFRDASNNIKGNISATGTDGFTLTFALTGTCGVVVTWFAMG